MHRVGYRGFVANLAELLKYYHTGCMTQISLKQARVAAGLTQVELARATHTTCMQIWRFEKGIRPITLQWARIFAPALNIAEPASLVSNMEDFPTWGLGRTPGGAEPKPLRTARPARRSPHNTPGAAEIGDNVQDADGDVVEASLNHLLLLYVRAMPPEKKDLLVTEAVDWARTRVRDRGLRTDRPGQLAINV